MTPKISACTSVHSGNRRVLLQGPGHRAMGAQLAATAQALAARVDAEVLTGLDRVRGAAGIAKVLQLDSDGERCLQARPPWTVSAARVDLGPRLLSRKDDVGAASGADRSQVRESVKAARGLAPQGLATTTAGARHFSLLLG